LINLPHQQFTPYPCTAKSSHDHIDQDRWTRQTKNEDFDPN
jgi:hypothetical protein